MRRLALALLVCVGCKNPEQQAAESRRSQVNEALADGHAAMAAREYRGAVAAFGKATALAPDDGAAFFLLAQAQREAGNETAAALALKRAEELSKGGDPAMKRERADLYRRMGQTSLAVATLTELRDLGQLTDPELLDLARLQARLGHTDAAWTTLEKVQAKKPDDVDGKIAEAEILLVKGDEVLGTRLVDTLLDDHPQLAGALLLRAKYFLTNGYPEKALSDLDRIGPEGQKSAEVLTLKARVLKEQQRFAEAAELLGPVVEQNPRDADLACQLAEYQLLAGKPDVAQELVEQALAQRDSFPRALYVRGLTLEAQGEQPNALRQHLDALKVEPGFAPALSRVWQLYLKKGEKNEAMGALERLLFMKEASPKERIALAALYADTGVNLERGRKLIDEQLKKSPRDPELKELKKRLGKGKPKSGGGVQIIRKRR
ncbi:MAG: tetratricopeptide repeat protein [Archangiaceae bacterium]|nr:tetratricopeptide repeat protein [Archangiaceae bacterium]